MNRSTRLKLKLHNLLFAVLLLAAAALLAVLGQRYHGQWDATLNARNSLSQASLRVLHAVQGPVTITAYATRQDARLGDIRKLIQESMAPYLRAKPDMSLRFVDPSEQPKLAKEAGVKLNGEMVVAYGKRSEHLTVLNEETLTNLLMRLARSSERQVLYLDGHGERKLDGIANYDLGDFGRQLRDKGFLTAPLNLALAQDVPVNAALLVIASPQVDVLPGEEAKIERYLDKGGNLLWLIDPEPLHGLQPLADKLGLALNSGIVVDPAAQDLSLPPTVALATAYGYHPVTQYFNLLTVFPLARQIGIDERRGWHSTALVEAAPRGWVATGKLEGDLRFDSKRDIPGPVTLGITLERQVEDKSQRVAVIGNGAFLSNTYLGNGGNLDLGVNLVNWLAGDDRLIAIQPRAKVDNSLVLNKTSAAIIGLGFLVGLPLAFLVAAVAIWRRRRNG